HKLIFAVESIVEDEVIHTDIREIHDRDVHLRDDIIPQRVGTQHAFSTQLNREIGADRCIVCKPNRPYPAADTVGRLEYSHIDAFASENIGGVQTRYACAEDTHNSVVTNFRLWR